MATLKSASITAWDATPIVEATTGEGGPGFLKSVNDGVQLVTGGAPGDIYRLVRIPTNAKIKKLTVNYTTGSTAGAVDLDVAFSDSTVDGTNQALAGGIVQVTGPVDNKLFGAAQSIISALVQVDKTFSGTFTLAMQNLPIWQALVNLGATQFTADPGGWFDIVAKSTTAPTVTFGILAAQVDYVE